MTTKTELTEGEKQEISRGFVQREVLAHVGVLVDKILDVETCDGEFHEWLDEAVAECCGWCDECETETDGGYECVDCGACKEPVEIYEWWMVTAWLGEKLKTRGHVVIDYGIGQAIWGRQCTGQAILLDDDIMELALEFRRQGE